MASRVINPGSCRTNPVGPRWVHARKVAEHPSGANRDGASEAARQQEAGSGEKEQGASGEPNGARKKNQWHKIDEPEKGGREGESSED